jgi:acyl carrier protein
MKNVFDFILATVDDLVEIDFDLERSTKVQDIGLASLDYIEIQVLVKKQYGVIITDEIFTSGKIKTLGDMENYIIENAAETVAAL